MESLQKRHGIVAPEGFLCPSDPPRGRWPQRGWETVVKKSEMKRLLLFVALWLCVPMAVQAQRICFVFMSDPHYGLEREFRGRRVSAEVVNRAMAEAVAALPAQQLPDDGGVQAGEEVGALDFVVCGGDIANRMEQGVQPAAES